MIKNVVKARVNGLKRRQKYAVCTDEARANKHTLEKSRYAVSKTADMLQEYKRLIKQLFFRATNVPRHTTQETKCAQGKIILK